MKQHDLEIQPLPIPSGWKVMWNHLLKTDITSFPPDDRIWFYLTEDLVYIVPKKPRNNADNYAIDLGWYPDGNPDGQYGLVVIRNNDWNNPVESVDSRNHEEIVKKIEEFLIQYRPGK